MSNAATRTAIAAAINTVVGSPLHAFEHKPNAPRAGDCWPQWSGGQRDEQSVGLFETWRVVIVAGQASAADADDFVDLWGQQLLAALATVLFVDSITPVKLDSEAGDWYALMITGRSE